MTGAGSAGRAPSADGGRESGEVALARHRRFERRLWVRALAAAVPVLLLVWAHAQWWT